MQTKFRWIVLLLGSVLLLGAFGFKAAPIPVVPEGAPAGDLTGMKPCEYQPAGGNTKFSAECGTLVVPENWDKAGSRLIALPVVRIPASLPNPAEPVFLLEGGPGQSNLSWDPPAWLLEKHDALMVGYRGADGTVVLSCPDLGRVLKSHLGTDLYSEQAHSAYARAAKQCAETHQAAGVDLSGYSVPGVVQDLEAVRKALGYGRINLFGESYGTRVAQVYAYLHPDSARRLVLLGVNTPGHFIWQPAVLDKLIGHMSELCARDATCSSRTPDFGKTMYAVNHHMPERWLVFNIDPDTIRLSSQMMFFSNSSMATIFDAYLAAAEGDPSGLAMLNLLIPMMLPLDQMVIYGDSFSKGRTIDLEKYGGLASISLGNSIMGAPLSEMLWPLASEWPGDLIPPKLRELQETDVEMLLVNGTLDFSTPPNALDEARPYFHKAQMVLLPEFSHVGDVRSLQPKAFERLISSYYDTGVADSSLFVYQPLPFRAGMSPTLMAKVLVVLGVVLPLLLGLGVVLVVRRMRRRTAHSLSS